MLAGRIERNEWELQLLRARAEGERRGAGGAMDQPSQRPRLHLLIQWQPLAVHRHHAHLARVRHGASAWAMRCWVSRTQRVNLLARLLAHAQTSAQYNIYYGEGRDHYDVPELRGRTAHEAIFNPASGAFRCPSSQQGYSPFTTWTRGLAWAMLGFAEQLEFVQSLAGMANLAPTAFRKRMMRARCWSARPALPAISTCTRRARGTASAIGTPARRSLPRLGDWQAPAADPFNDYEPVDSSASAIAAQGLIRLGHALGDAGSAYMQAGLTVLRRLLEEPYLSTDPHHEGILLHSVYHRPNGWDYDSPGAKDSLRRVEHVGRLSSAGGDAAGGEDGRGKLLHVLRGSGSREF